MATYNSYIRIYLPLDANRKPATGGSGHYNLQVNMSNFSLTVKEYGSTSTATTTRTYTNPIISYGDVGGYVQVCNATNLSVTGTQMLATCPFTVDTAAVNALKAWLETHCEYGYTSNGFDYYRVVSGNFVAYDLPRYNCFSATATWCKEMGNNVLWNIYQSKSYPNGTYNPNGYKDYYAWPMFATYHRAWVFNTLSLS